MCIFSTRRDIKAIYVNDREAFDSIVALEKKTGYTLKNGESLIQIATSETTPQDEHEQSSLEFCEGVA